MYQFCLYLYQTFALWCASEVELSPLHQGVCASLIKHTCFIITLLWSLISAHQEEMEENVVCQMSGCRVRNVCQTITLQFQIVLENVPVWNGQPWGRTFSSNADPSTRRNREAAVCVSAQTAAASRALLMFHTAGRRGEEREAEPDRAERGAADTQQRSAAKTESRPPEGTTSVAVTEEEFRAPTLGCNDCRGRSAGRGGAAAMMALGSGLRQDGLGWVCAREPCRAVPCRAGWTRLPSGSAIPRMTWGGCFVFEFVRGKFFSRRAVRVLEQAAQGGCGCSVPGGVHGRVGWGPGHPDLVKRGSLVTLPGRGLELRDP
ncbi:uncharacterized protein LOC116653889 [Coturnix japonica]|uniref:uncharacterized protein LOC116653889 n=1 Tax=Coturnix japonica TaxID=93934 RepID=UPI0013A5EBB4|nr:uncharacterized protein LOC116653889 [Coturnix japonica]XP_032302641.1 uncharacterized protein LOC116653889 [Coturnix japonica]XP_032302642.1 uncharacterized protein LOC116653889 [Coturnix japonica]XP_032302643.1 uncharacterized protein LOC116653889 [Coturnix japonica]XP_032302644.1 uncharacterized protein LOC116653889 [Coturnix japonica]XP_032302645.1 uncharacterized protein LOC116653889 [Coturnix japonica]XP_032302646.1 uncharacterized protein LOC116653889 [Coturnix japonica]XP_03230264